jgi:eukaryotic-like serine/threonine-protein kinase
MSSELRDRLQSTLGGAYSLERELGGGGMSRVFVAEEKSLGRKVVVKVLSPELAAGLSVERFRREIQVAAKLQQANIVPVLSSGETDGLPYYTMPMVEGLSLRGRLATTGALPMGETIGILKDVSKALSYAHEHGIVHRDIKPDNVLLSGGTAVVTDFGIAKAISESRAHARAEGRTSGGGSTLTAIGTSLGTPAYMAPEQAAGDPGTDHRADLYALGIMAYEMLAGRTPFHGLSPHKLIAAQMGETPRSIAEVRPDAPAALAELVSALLAKDPERRPRSASDVVRVLEAVTSSGSDSMAAAPVLLTPRVALWKALALYAAAAISVPIVARAAVIAIGLPEWVFPASIVVMAMGLPVILATHVVQRMARRALTSTPTLTPGGTPVQRTVATMAVRVSPHMTWKRAAWGGVAAVGTLVFVTAAWMTLRAMGIGPAGSLMAAGVLGERERLLLADFRSPANDSTLGPIVTDALRADLAQSRSIDLLQPASVRESLRRMQRESATIDFSLAREIATREGVKAVIDGEVLGIGGSYILTARLVATQEGSELATFREEAREARDLISAIGRLSRDIRARIGESLRDVQSTPSLERVSTASLEALRRYVQGNRALTNGDSERGVRYLEEAVAIDTAFGMAYRRLAVEYFNRGGSLEQAVHYIQKAYQHRNRMSDAERYLTEGSYWTTGPRQDFQKAIDAYETLLELQPENGPALNNLANRLLERREFARAESLRVRAVQASPTSALYVANLAAIVAQTGRIGEAQAMLDRYEREQPPTPMVPYWKAQFAWVSGRFDEAGRIMDSVRRSSKADPITREGATMDLADLNLLRGRLRDFRRLREEAASLQRPRGAALAELSAAAQVAEATAWFTNDMAGGAALLDRAVRQHEIESIAEADRPYDALAMAYAATGRHDRARALLPAMERRASQGGRLVDKIGVAVARGHVALAERRYTDAVRAYQDADVGPCTSCAPPLIARAFDLAGQVDSAIVYFERFVNDPLPVRTITTPLYRAGAHKRLGELHEGKGDRSKALDHYLRFVELWKDADPELQPRVAEVRARIARLRDTEGR